MDAAVSVRAVHRTFEQDTAPIRALRGADLEVRRGEFAAVMGPSGCGKSTLLNMIAGLDVPDEGQVVVAGEDITGYDENALARMRRRHIGFVFQFFNLLEGMTVQENVVMPALIAGSKRKVAEARARDLLDLLGIGDKAKQAPGVLSGGQRQRLAIARALANEPTVVLADEPTGALDSEGGAEVLELFRRLHAERSDHHHGDARREGGCCSRVHRPDEGRPRGGRHRAAVELRGRSLRVGEVALGRAAVRPLLRSALRSRWASLLMVALVAGLGFGAVLAAAAGARRTLSAPHRLYEERLMQDVALFGPPDINPSLVDLLRSSPSVAGLGEVAVAPVRLQKGQGLEPEAVEANQASLWLWGPGLGTDIRVPTILEGRLPDPSTPGEAIVSRRHAEDLGVGVGSTFTPLATTRADIECIVAQTCDQDRPFTVPVPIEIVGIAQFPDDLDDDAFAEQVEIEVGPATLTAMADEIGVVAQGARCSIRRLRPGCTSAGRVERGALRGAPAVLPEGRGSRRARAVLDLRHQPCADHLDRRAPPAGHRAGLGWCAPRAGLVRRGIGPLLPPSAAERTRPTGPGGPRPAANRALRAARPRGSDRGDRGDRHRRRRGGGALTLAPVRRRPGRRAGSGSGLRQHGPHARRRGPGPAAGRRARPGGLPVDRAAGARPQRDHLPDAGGPAAPAARARHRNQVRARGPVGGVAGAGHPHGRRGGGGHRPRDDVAAPVLEHRPRADDAVGGREPVGRLRHQLGGTRADRSRPRSTAGR